jgi:hypothetical protein
MEFTTSADPMKRRSSPLVWVEEDAAIWRRWARHPRMYAFLVFHSFEQDGRDANLFYGYERAKARLIAQRGTATYWEVRYLALSIALEAQG